MSQDWLLRGLGPDDRDALCLHLHGLPPGLRYQRFGHLYGDATLDEIARRIDFNTDVFCGVFAPDGAMVGLVQAAPEPDERSFELAFSVLPDWHHKGFASALGERIFRMLAARGARNAWIRCFRTNLAMRCLALRLGFSLREQGVMVCGERELNLSGSRLGSPVRRHGF